MIRNCRYKYKTDVFIALIDICIVNQPQTSHIGKAMTGTVGITEIFCQDSILRG